MSQAVSWHQKKRFESNQSKLLSIRIHLNPTLEKKTKRGIGLIYMLRSLLIHTLQIFERDKCIKPSVLCFHSLNEKSPQGCSPSVFRELCEFISGKGWGSSLADIENAVLSSIHKELVAFTFDDSSQDCRTVAAPILADAGMTATAFITTSSVGDRNHRIFSSNLNLLIEPLLSWDEIGKLRDRGWEIGSHMYRHLNCHYLSLAEFEDEVGRAEADFIKYLGVLPKRFAFPYGKYKIEQGQLLYERGYISVWGTSYGTASNLLEGHVMRRNLVRHSDSLSVILVYLRDGEKVDKAMKFIETARSITGKKVF